MTGLLVEAVYADGTRKQIWAPTAEAVARVVCGLGHFTSVFPVDQEKEK